MADDRKSFNPNKSVNPTFAPTVTTPTKRVSSPTQDIFGSNALDRVLKNKETDNVKKIPKTKSNNFENKPLPKQKKKRGRPIEVTDPLDKVDRPKMISTSTELKLNVLQDFVTEFQEVKGRITFDKYIDTLVDSYVNRNLTYSKQEAFKRELESTIKEKRK